MQLHIEGLPLRVVVQALTTYREEIKKAEKKDEKMGLPVTSHREVDKVAADLLEQLGFAPAGKSTAEVTDRKQIPLPLGDTSSEPHVVNARVKCITCARMFAVPPGDTMHGCPDCGTIHRVKADSYGEIFFQREVALATPAMLDLIRRKQAEVPDLTAEEEATLADWLKAHPDYVVEQPAQGMRVADPAVPGSGNPLRFDCRTITGTDCDGFDGTDTPGASVCQKCGNKYTVEIINGIVLQRPWRPEDDEAVDVAPAEPSEYSGDRASDDDYDDDADDEAGSDDEGPADD